MAIVENADFRSIASSRYINDVIEPAISVMTTETVPVLQAYRTAELNEHLTAVLTGLLTRFFDPLVFLSWASSGGLEVPEHLVVNPRLSEELGPQTLLGTGAFEQVITTLMPRLGEGRSESSTMGSAIYTTLVHARDPEVDLLMAVTTFATDEEWQNITRRLNDVAEGVESVSDRLHMMTELPAWISDGPARWRELIRFIGTDLLLIPHDAFSSAARALAAEGTGPDPRFRSVLAAALDHFPSLPFLELRLVHLAAYVMAEGLQYPGFFRSGVINYVELSSFVHDAISTQLLTTSRRVGNSPNPPSISLLSRAAWRLLPPPLSQARLRIAELEDVTHAVSRTFEEFDEVNRMDLRSNYRFE